MTFKKGQSGNPAGRPKGIVDHRLRYRKELDESAPKIVATLLQKALDGDVACLKICADRIIPQLKASDAAINIQFSGDLTEKGNQVLEALGAGELSPGEATTVMASLQSQSRLTVADDLVRRIEKLEETANGGH